MSNTSVPTAAPTGVITRSGCVANHEATDFDKVSWIIAISLAILAAISNNLGVNLQKLAWTRKQRNMAQRNYRIIWIIGMLGIVLASVFDFVALAFGPQSVIAPLGALTMVMNGCVAPVMHGEKLRKRVIGITVIIVSGCAMAVATANHENIICSLDGIFSYFASLTFLGYAIVVLFISLCTFLFIRKAERTLKEKGDLSEEYERIYRFHRISYAFIAGLYGAQSVVFARAIGQLVMSSSRGEPLFLARYETWLILLALVAMIVVQIIYLNKGLERFESTYNVPVFTGTFIVGTAVAGGVVYSEFSGFSKIQAILFPLGVSLCVLGVFALAWGNDVDEEADKVDLEAGPVEITPSIQPDIASYTGRPRLHSGGFTPFIITGPADDTPTARSGRRGSVQSRDLLTGLRTDELQEVLRPPHIPGKVGEVVSKDDLLPITPRTSHLGADGTTTPRGSQVSGSTGHSRAVAPVPRGSALGQKPSDIK